MDDIKTNVCRNPWCKATFMHKDADTMTQCPKCKSFDNELSGGVTWVDKKYEGPRMDGMPHNIKIDVKKYFK